MPWAANDKTRGPCRQFIDALCSMQDFHLMGKKPHANTHHCRQLATVLRSDQVGCAFAWVGAQLPCKACWHISACESALDVGGLIAR